MLIEIQINDEIPFPSHNCDVLRSKQRKKSASFQLKICFLVYRSMFVSNSIRAVKVGDGGETEKFILHSRCCRKHENYTIKTFIDNH